MALLRYGPICKQIPTRLRTSTDSSKKGTVLLGLFYAQASSGILEQRLLRSGKWLAPPFILQEYAKF
jgi:hypothetical protein